MPIDSTKLHIFYRLILLYNWKDHQAQISFFFTNLINIMLINSTKLYFFNLNTFLLMKRLQRPKQINAYLRGPMVSLLMLWGICKSILEIRRRSPVAVNKKNLVWHLTANLYTFKCVKNKFVPSDLNQLCKTTFVSCQLSGYCAAYICLWNVPVQVYLVIQKQW